MEEPDNKKRPPRAVAARGKIVPKGCRIQCGLRVPDSDLAARAATAIRFLVLYLIFFLRPAAMNRMGFRVDESALTTVTAW